MSRYFDLTGRDDVFQVVSRILEREARQVRRRRVRRVWGWMIRRTLRDLWRGWLVWFAVTLWVSLTLASWLCK